MSNNVGRTTDLPQASPLDDDTELDRILNIYVAQIKELTRRGIIDNNLEPLPLPNGQTLKQAIKTWAAKQAVETFTNGFNEGYEAGLKSLQQGEKK